MFAALVGLLSHWLLPGTKMTPGLRIPLLLGCAIIPLLFRSQALAFPKPQFRARQHKPERFSEFSGRSSPIGTRSY